MDARKPFAKRLKSGWQTLVPLLAPALQLLIALALLFVASRQFALDIHIREPGFAVSVALEVSDRDSVQIYSFTVPPIADGQTRRTQEEPT